MPKKSKVDLAGLLERADKMHSKENLTHEEIAEIFRQEGYDISKSSVQRALRAKKISEKEYKDKLEAAKIFVDATKDTPGLQLAKAGTDMLMAMILKEIQGMDDLSSLEDSELIDKLAKITKCQNDIAKTNLNYEKGYKAGLFKIQKVIEELNKDRAIPEVWMSQIMSKISEG